MRICYLSSDVCSSDLSLYHAGDSVTIGDASSFVAPVRPKATPLPKVDVAAGLSGIPSREASEYVAELLQACNTAASDAKSSGRDGLRIFSSNRSEERRDGKECVTTSRPRWWRY